MPLNSQQRALLAPVAPPEDTPEESRGPGVGTALAAAAGIGGAAFLARNPALARTALSKLGSILGSARYAAMLSGFAVPKSIAGNVGAAVTGALERKSLAPIKEFFSPSTVREFGRELRGGKGAAFGQATGRWNPMGRIMGAGDTATRGALQRAGLTGQ